MGARTMTSMESQTPAQAEAADGAPARQVDWWHREHPTFVALTGFFAGMLYVTAVPGGFIGLLRLALPYDQAVEWFGWVAVSVLLPVVLVVLPRTRRFGKYMFLGMALTALVVLGVASLVLWLMIATD